MEALGFGGFGDGEEFFGEGTFFVVEAGDFAFDGLEFFLGLAVGAGLGFAGGGVTVGGWIGWRARPLKRARRKRRLRVRRGRRFCRSRRQRGASRCGPNR